MVIKPECCHSVQEHLEFFDSFIHKFFSFDYFWPVGSSEIVEDDCVSPPLSYQVSYARLFKSKQCVALTPIMDAYYLCVRAGANLSDLFR